VKVNASFVAATFEGPTILKYVVLFSCIDATCFGVNETIEMQITTKGKKTKEKSGNARFKSTSEWKTTKQKKKV